MTTQQLPEHLGRLGRDLERACRTSHAPHARLTALAGPRGRARACRDARCRAAARRSRARRDRPGDRRRRCAALLPVEQSSQAGAVTQYDPSANVLFVRSIPGGTLEGNRATRIGADPERVTRFLDQGNTRDEGVVDVDGRRVRRFLITQPMGGTCTYDVDPDTYYGLGFACQGGPNGHGVETWEYLPRTPESSRLLSVADQHPSARIDRAAMQTCSRPDQYEIPSMPPCYVDAPGG
jgi:hypothetical protein